jgi:2-dehydro-3-deoxyphosphooctonate aldolase (KDO 8-P synthase)
MREPSDLFAESGSELFFIAGPCVLESLEVASQAARELARLSQDLGVRIIFKSSFDKANRTSVQGFRGPGLSRGLEWLSRIKESTGLPITTDIHEPAQAAEVAQVADVLQIPAFLSRQTDLLVEAGRTGRIVNVKKGQFLAPWDMKGAVDKIASTGNGKVWLTERGTGFGYNNLVVDFRSLPIMRDFRLPVVFDATHSVQLPGGRGSSSGGQREFVPVLARAAVAAGCSGVFFETHPDPDSALCDGPNSWPLRDAGPLISSLLRMRQALAEPIARQ